MTSLRKLHVFLNRTEIPGMYSLFPSAIGIWNNLNSTIIDNNSLDLSKKKPFDIFQFSKDLTGRVGRNINRLFVPRVFTNFGKRSFFYCGAVLWNYLPLNVSEAASVPSFRNSYFNLK